MNLTDLGAVGAGFSDLARDSQALFRVALRALSHPGRPVDLPQSADVPAGVSPASAVLLLALLDSDTRVWLSPTLADSGAPAWLRFHTGCTFTKEPVDAHFAWSNRPDDLPAQDRFAQGSDDCPDRSTTCVLDVPALSDANGGINTPYGHEGDVSDAWVLSGPGIDGHSRLRVNGLSRRFALQFLEARAANHAKFPKGVDLFLAAPRQIVGLPRTTRVELQD